MLSDCDTLFFFYDSIDHHFDIFLFIWIRILLLIVIHVVFDFLCYFLIILPHLFICDEVNSLFRAIIEY